MNPEYFHGTGRIGTAENEASVVDLRLGAEPMDDGGLKLTILRLANIHLYPHAVITLGAAEAEKLRVLLM